MNRRAPLDGYWSTVPSHAQPAQLAAFELPAMRWDVPFELALACAQSGLAPLAWARAARGVLPASTALVTPSGRHLVAALTYPTGDLFLPLRVQLLERRR